MQRAGNYPPPLGAPDILGLDMAGRIIQKGANVTGWKVGDRVCALLAGGGYAEQVAVPYRMLMPIPDHWSYEQAAAVPEVFLTAFINLFMEAGLREGESVLIHGGASGVGTAAIQLGRMAGCRVFATAGTQKKIERCMKLGAELAVNYNDQDFFERICAQTNSKGVDVILDIVGADYIDRNIRLLKPKGRLVVISTLSGSEVELDLRLLMKDRLRLIGSVLRPRPLPEKVEGKERFITQFWPLMLDGTIRPIIDSVYPIEQVEQAHQRMAENKNIGKIILKIRE